MQPSGGDLRRGWEVWRDQHHAGYRAVQAGPLTPSWSLQLLVDSVEPTLANELVELQDFRILVLPPPRIERTASRVPTPAWSVTPALGLPSATAGVLASNRQGHVGVTTALHGLRQAVARVVPGATQAFVGGVSGVVDSIDEISDSAFIALGPDNPSTLLPGPAMAVAGPLSGLSPRERDVTTFTVASGPKQAYVTGWDKDIPFVRPFSQLRVYTTPATSPGDSGVALLDSDGRVLGFAFYRTGLGEPIEYSAWVWADSVYYVHGLQ